MPRAARARRHGGTPYGANRGGYGVQDEAPRPVCRYYQGGLCTRGPKCWYQHDLAVPSTSASVASRICHFHRTGGCAYGDVCRFIHIPPGARPSPALASLQTDITGLARARADAAFLGLAALGQRARGPGLGLPALPPLPVLPARRPITPPYDDYSVDEEFEEEDSPPPMEYDEEEEEDAEEVGDDEELMDEEDEHEEDIDADEEEQDEQQLEELDEEDDEEDMDKPSERSGGSDAESYNYRRDGSGSGDDIFASFGGVRVGPMPGEYRASAPRYAAHQTVTFSTEHHWDRGRLVPGIRSLTFGEKFIWCEPQHIQDLVSSGVGVCQGLEVFEVQGVGWQLTDACILSLAAACPSLTHVTLDGCHNLSDAAIFALVEGCQRLRFLSMSGPGATRIKGAAFEHLAAHPEVAPRLSKIHFLDRSDSLWNRLGRALKRLSKARPYLPIVTGESDDKDGAPFNVWRNGKEVYQFDLF